MQRVSNKELEIVLQQYGVISSPYQIRQLSKKGIWVVNEQFVVKQLKNKAIASNTCNILDLLNKDNLIIGKHIYTSNGQAFVHCMKGDFIIKEFTRGKSFKIEEALRQCDTFGYKTGSALASLHSSFAVNVDGKFEVADTMLEYDEAIRFLYDKNILIPVQIVEECELFKSTYHRLPKQIIHRDIHLGNIIIDDSFDVHFVDFDSCEINTRIFDLAYFGMSSLDYINDNSDLRRWQVLFAFFLQGYYDQIKLNQEEIVSIWKMILVLQICFIRYFFEKDNKIEARISKLEYVYNHRNDIIEQTLN